jgi:hypothetical protein
MQSRKSLDANIIVHIDVDAEEPLHSLEEILVPRPAPTKIFQSIRMKAMTQSKCNDEVEESTNLLKLLNGTLVDTAALVDQVACDSISM